MPEIEPDDDPVPPGPTPAEHGAAIIAARDKAGLRSGQLAERLGVTRATMSDWECGRTVLSLDRLWSIAWKIGCDPTDLDERLSGWKGQTRRPKKRRPPKGGKATNPPKPDRRGRPKGGGKKSGKIPE